MSFRLKKIRRGSKDQARACHPGENGGLTLHRQIAQLAWPMILSNLTVPLLGLVDTAILGHLPKAHYLGAVAVAAIIFDMLFWSFGFLRMGTTSLSSQAYGAGDLNETRAILYKSLLLAAGFGLVLVLFQAPLFALAFWYMDPSAEVERYARIYCDIRIYSAPAILCDYVVVGWLLSIGKPRQVLVIALITNLINLVLDYWLVVHLDMLTDGVAWGSLISSLAGLILGLSFVHRVNKRHSSTFPLNHLFVWAGYLKLLKINRYLFLRTLCLLFSFSFFYAQSAQQDTITLSANSVLMTMFMLFAYGADGFANALEVLAGRAIGAKQLPLFYRVSAAASLWAILFSAVFAATIGIFDRAIISLLTDIAPVISATLIYWPWLVLLPFIAGWNFMLDGIFVGAGKAYAMQNTMLVSSFFVFFPAWYLFRPLENHGLWLAFCFFHAARSISMALVYYYYSKGKDWLESSAA